MIISIFILFINKNYFHFDGNQLGHIGCFNGIMVETMVQINCGVFTCAIWVVDVFFCLLFPCILIVLVVKLLASCLLCLILLLFDCFCLNCALNVFFFFGFCFFFVKRYFLCIVLKFFVYCVEILPKKKMLNFEKNSKTCGFFLSW